MSLAGELGQIAFSDVLQLCVKIKSTGALLLTSGETGVVFGRFFFNNGELVDAQLGTLEGAEAVHRALELTAGGYHFDLGVRARERRIFASVETILLDGVPEESPLQLVDSFDGGIGMTTRAQVDWICPVCSQHFDTEGECPDHRATLIRAPRPSTSPQTTPRRVAVWVAMAATALAATIVAIALHVRRAPQTEPKASTSAIAVAPQVVPAPASIATVAGVSDSEIRFGMVAPFSGPAKELGRQMRLGIEAVFNTVNDAGGIGGRRISVVVADDGYEPARTGEAMKDLRDKKKVFGFIGNVGTPTAAVALPLALEHKMMFFGAFTGANLLRNEPPDRYVFNFRASYAEETAAVVRYLIKVRHVRPDSIAVFAQQDAFGDAGYAGVTKAMRELRIDIRAPRVGYQRNTANVSEAVANLRERARSTPIRAVVMVATYRAAARFIEKTRDIFPKMIFTNVSFVGSTELAEELKLLGRRYTSGVIVTQVVPPVEGFSTAVLKYKEALNKYFPGEKPDYVSLEGYCVASVLVEGIRRAGHEIDSERLVDALESIRELDLGFGTPLTFGLTEHQASHRVWGTELNESGSYEVIELR